MKTLNILILTLFTTLSIIAQSDHYNIQKGYVAKGFDVVSYFDNKAEKGDKKYTVEYEDVKFKFTSKENLDKFNSDPESYIPQYGGYCAYAIGKNSDKVKINPETYEIRDGKLYLFYHTIFANTLDKWLEEGPENLKTQADQNWMTIKKDDQ
ncbi:MAG: YHS domain-containing protein [Saprospiraceae bacterium]|jgi:YHS domain-containing protein|tara:strand:+ start:2186 stop:2641 length:456 start_codon:yes stop_codon:yes gene_type:complete